MLAIRVCSSVYLNYESRYSDAVFHPVGKIKPCQRSRLLIINHVLLVTNYIFQTTVSKYCSCFCLVIEIMPTGWIDGWWNLEANRLVLRRSSRVTRPPRALIMCHILYEMDQAGYLLQSLQSGQGVNKCQFFCWRALIMCHIL